MFWWGRVNSLIQFAFFGGLGLFLLAGQFGAAFGWMFVIILVRVALFFVNMVWTMVTGDPLFYDTKVLPPRNSGSDQE